MSAENVFQIHGVLASYWNGEGNPLSGFHRHNEIELGLLTEGEAVYSLAGRSVAMPIGKLCAFWGGFSHRLISWQPYGEIWSLAVPLAIFLDWSLPQESFVHRLLHGQLLVESDETQSALDMELVRRWHRDLNRPAGNGRDTREIVLLELHARVWRLASSGRAASPLSHRDRGEAERVARMLGYVAEHYAEAVTVAEVAAAADINPGYAMEVFKRSCGMSIMRYVNDQRVAHARRMLASSDAKVLDVAMEAGFGSVSQFYNVFRQMTGQTPRQFTRSHIAPAAG